MRENQPARTSFVGDLQVAWDSTSLTTLMACPRKYEYQMVRGFVPRALSVHLVFGLHYHKAMERYHHGIARLRASANERGENFSSPSESERDSVIANVVRLALQDSAGWKSDDKYKNREFLIRSIVWAFEEFKNDPAETIILANGQPAVELSFRFELPLEVPAVVRATAMAGSDDPRKPGVDKYLYCGHIDRLATFSGRTWVFDYKSTKSALTSHYWQGFLHPNNQMTGYTIGAKVAYHQPVAGVMVEGAQILIEGTRYARQPTLRTESQLDEWFATASYHIKAAESYAKANYWPMNPASCGNYGGCPFLEVCSKPPAQRETWLKADFESRWWDPLETRGDV